MRPQEFIDTIGYAAQASMKLTGIPASFVIAEAALESAWGASRLSTEGMNLFGVKADKSWEGDVLTMNTREFMHGSWIIVAAKWRKYTDWLSCIKDHADFFHKNPRYAHALEVEGDAIAFTKAVADAGYATDPAYADKIISIINAHDLLKLDDGEIVYYDNQRV